MTPTQENRDRRRGRRDDRDLLGIPPVVDPEWRSRDGIRTLPPALARALRDAAGARRWTATELGRQVDIGRRHAAYLVRGERVPSRAVAERLIDALGLQEDVAAGLLEVARPLAGESSPYRAVAS